MTDYELEADAPSHDGTVRALLQEYEAYRDDLRTVAKNGKVDEKPQRDR